MASYNKINKFVLNLAQKVFNLGSDALKIAITNTTPAPTTENQLSNLTEITYTNLSSRSITTSSSTQTTGTYKLVVADLTLTSSGGSTGPLRYVYLYDDTATNKELIGYWDYGSAITLADTETLLLDFDGTNGVLQIA